MKKQIALSAAFAIYALMASQPAFAKPGICESGFGRISIDGRVYPRYFDHGADTFMNLVKADGSRLTVKLGKSLPGQKASVDSSLLGKSKLFSTVPESKGIKRLGVHKLLEGRFKPVLIAEDEKGAIFGPSGTPLNYEGTDYYEFPNSTLTSVVDKETGKRRTWMVTRGIRYYTVHVNRITGEISPKGYVSDLLMFEIVKGEPVFHSVFLKSLTADVAKAASEKYGIPVDESLIEDPRFKNKRGKRQLALTDYSAHVDRADNPKRDKDVMNRAIDVEFTRRGEPVALKVDPITKRPLQWTNLSPAPKKNADGSYTFVDAKNATTLSWRGVKYLFTRLRPNFADKATKAMFGNEKWAYAEQVYGFRSEADFEAYDKTAMLPDLAKQPVSRSNSVTALYADELMRDTDLTEYYKVDPTDTDTEIKIGEKGLGGGIAPRVLVRMGNLLLISDGDGEGMYLSGRIPDGFGTKFPMKSGDEVMLKIDHEILKYYQKSALGKMKRRFYPMAVKILSVGRPKVIAFRPNVIQPLTEHELGYQSGIMDLAGHSYAMGGAIVESEGTPVIHPISAPQAKELIRLHAAAQADASKREDYVAYENALVQELGLADFLISAGESDAHTELLSVETVTVVQEAFDFTAIHGVPGQERLQNSQNRNRP